MNNKSNWTSWLLLLLLLLIYTSYLIMRTFDILSTYVHIYQACTESASEVPAKAWKLGNRHFGLFISRRNSFKNYYLSTEKFDWLSHVWSHLCLHRLLITHFKVKSSSTMRCKHWSVSLVYLYNGCKQNSSECSSPKLQRNIGNEVETFNETSVSLMSHETHQANSE